MTEAQTILNLIEKTPSDTAMLEEIAARVWCLLEGYIFETIDLANPDVGFPVLYYAIPKSQQTFGQWHPLSQVLQVSHSLDAQATITPKIDFSISWHLKDDEYHCRCRSSDIKTSVLSTEALDRLHLIIQDFIINEVLLEESESLLELLDQKSTMTPEMRVALKNVLASIIKSSARTICPLDKARHDILDMSAE